MKKYIIGFVLGAVLFASSAVFGKSLEESKWYRVDTLKFDDSRITKTFDEETNIVCYALTSTWTHQVGSISCLKNN